MTRNGDWMAYWMLYNKKKAGIFGGFEVPLMHNFQWRVEINNFSQFELSKAFDVL